MEESSQTSLEWSNVRPVIITRPASVRRSKGGEALVRIALCCLSALLVTLVWILGGTGSQDAKTWSVIGLSAMAALALIAGLVQHEVDKVRSDLAASEDRIHAAIEGAMEYLGTEIRVQSMEVAEPSSYLRRRRRPDSRRRDPSGPDPGQLISDEFRLFMQGRESRDDEGPSGSW